MKTIKFLIAMVAIIFVGTTYYSCQKETQTTSVQDGAITNTLKSTYTGCESCINLLATPVQYFEKAESKTITWGNGQFSKTVDIIYYNTETSFVLKVRSTKGWSDLVINGISSWNGGPVVPNVWGEYSVQLPAEWAACNDYNFSLQVTGNGPPASFDVTYQLVGLCTEGTVMDYDGNVYHTVVIGTQTWMVENLKTTHYNDGETITLIEDDNVLWTSPGDAGAYCWYNNDESTYKDTYGALYNCHAVERGKLCPLGWHVPTMEEWAVLTDYLGGSGIAGGPLKEEGTAHWNSPNTGATNTTGFTALAGGYRTNYMEGNFHDLGIQGVWWSSKTDVFWGWFVQAQYNETVLGTYYTNKYCGFSVRCIKD
jgi:uncharacterized protein (TIGR02145 family)